MRFFLTSTLAGAIVLAVLPAMPQSANASTGVLRCRMPDGSSAYTNKACSAVGGKSMPLAADVMHRIARDQQRAHTLAATRSGIVTLSRSNGLRSNGLSDAAPAAVPRRPLSRGCATTPAQLAMDLRGSVALGDVNRVAESFDWAGMGHAQAQRSMARLQQLADRPVRRTEYFDAGIGDGMLFSDAGSSASMGAASLLQVTFDAGNGHAIVDFDVRRHNGCLFLRY